MKVTSRTHAGCFRWPVAANGLDEHGRGDWATGQVVAPLDVRAGLVLPLPDGFDRDNGPQARPGDQEHGLVFGCFDAFEHCYNMCADEVLRKCLALGGNRGSKRESDRCPVTPKTDVASVCGVFFRKPG